MAISPELKELYEQWYKWLGTTEVEERLDRVRADFGDVTVPYEEWLESHRWLWDTTEDYDPGHEITNKAMYESLCAHDGDELVVWLNLYRTEAELITFAVELIKKRYRERNELDKGERGRPKFDNSGAMYPLASAGYITPKELSKLFELHEKHKTWTRTQWELGEAMNLKDDEKGTDDEALSLEQLNLGDKHRSMSVIVNRKLKKIEQLKKNVAQGIFPSYK